MTEQEWQARYKITSLKGKIWTRTELRNRAVPIAASLITLTGKLPRRAVRMAVQSLLDDPEFMRPRSGMVPARVIEDVGMEAFLRLDRLARQGAKS